MHSPGEPKISSRKGESSRDNGGLIELIGRIAKNQNGSSPTPSPPKAGMVNINANAESSKKPGSINDSKASTSSKKKENTSNIKKIDKSIPPSFAFFTNFNESCLKIPVSDRDRSIIPWNHGIHDYVYGANQFNTGGKLTTEQLKRDVTPLKYLSSWNPLVVYRAVMIAVLFWIILTLSFTAYLISYDIQNYAVHVWWVFAIAGLISICFGVIMIICAKKHADRLSFDKGSALAKALKNCEEKFLGGTDFGLCAGSNGAWIEIGLKKALSKLILRGNFYRGPESSQDQSKEKLMGDIKDIVRGAKRGTVKLDVSSKDVSATLSKFLNSTMKPNKV